MAREFIWGDRFPQPVALITHGGVSGGFGGPSVPAGESAYHYLHDVLGSVVALTNAAGQVVERYTYDPYGKTVIEETSPITGLPTARLDASAFGNPFAWTGQRYDAGVRLYHFLFRGYSPSLGRWLQRDPAGYVGGPSLYEYVDSMSTYFIDPLGLQPKFPLSRRLRDLLDGARTETAQTGNEVGGVIFTKGSGLDGRRQIATDPATGTEDKSPDHVMPDSSTQHGEEFRGTFHTHTVDSSFSTDDFHWFLRQVFNDSATLHILATPDCTYVVQLRDRDKAKKCADSPAIVDKTHKEALDKCLRREGWQPPSSQSSQRCNDPVFNKCREEAAKAVAAKCGLRLYGGCGPNKDKPRRIR